MNQAGRRGDDDGGGSGSESGSLSSDWSSSSGSSGGSSSASDAAGPSGEGHHRVRGRRKKKKGGKRRADVGAEVSAANSRGPRTAVAEEEKTRVEWTPWKAQETTVYERGLAGSEALGAAPAVLTAEEAAEAAVVEERERGWAGGGAKVKSAAPDSTSVASAEPYRDNMSGGGDILRSDGPGVRPPGKLQKMQQPPGAGATEAANRISASGVGGGAAAVVEGPGKAGAQQAVASRTNSSGIPWLPWPLSRLSTASDGRPLTPTRTSGGELGGGAGGGEASSPRRRVGSSGGGGGSISGGEMTVRRDKALSALGAAGGAAGLLGSGVSSALALASQVPRSSSFEVCGHMHVIGWLVGALVSQGCHCY